MILVPRHPLSAAAQGSAIINTDSCQFIGPRFTSVLTADEVRISIKGRGRWMDNVFIKRLRRSLKYECVDIHAFEISSFLRAGLMKWVSFNNTAWPHSALDGRIPDKDHYQTETPASPRPSQARLGTKLAALRKTGNSLTGSPICPTKSD